MLRKIITLILCFISPNLVLSSPIIIGTDAFKDLTNLTTIDKYKSNLVSTITTNLLSDWLKYGCASNSDGSILLSRAKIIELQSGEYNVIDLPEGRKWCSHPLFSKKMNSLLFWEADVDLPNIMYTYDILKKIISASHTFVIERYSFLSREYNCEGTTVVICDGYYLNFFIKQGDKFIKSSNTPHSSISNLFVSESGNRVFYFAVDEKNKYNYVYVDRIESEWSSEKSISPSLAPFETPGTKELKMCPGSIADDGKTVILLTNKNNVALIHEKDGTWSEPEIAGDYGTPLTENDMGIWTDMPIYASDDGRVIILEQAKYVHPDYGILSFSIYAFIKGDDGRWSKQLISDPERGGRKGVLLSGDGSKLYWVPFTDPFHQPSGIRSGNLK